MTHGRQKPLVPITREFLKQFYQKYPLTPVPYEARLTHLQRTEALALEVTKPGSKVPEQFGMPSPTRIDDCFWRNRMICEELALSMSKLQKAFMSQPGLAAACGRCHDLLVDAERSIFAVQERNTASVKAQLQQFIPQDFRGSLLERQRISTEARFKKQVDDLVRRGGTIRQKYDLYLQQQWERRQSLVQLGECSGMYKMVIKWVAGIPQVLLDFAKEINAKLGPMEEQRIKYGPDLYGITELGIKLDVCLAAWAEAAAATATAAAAAPRMAEIVQPAVVFYCEQMLRVIQHIGDVFQHSPFFVNKDDLELQGAAGGCAAGRDGEVEGAAAVAAAAAAAAAAEKHHPHPSGADIECGSSTLSVVSASANGDYGAAAAKTHAAAVVVVAPLPLLLAQAPSVTPPSTPGMLLEPQAPRSAQMFSPASAGDGGCGSADGAAAATAVPVILAACPEKQQLLPRFDAKVNGGRAPAAPATINAAVTAACGGGAAAATAAPLHRIATPPPRELVAAAAGVAVHGHGTPPSGLRVGLSTMSVESHMSFMSALDHHTWLIAEEGEQDAAWPVERPPHHSHHQQRSSSSSQPRQPQQYLTHQHQQPQGQGQVVVFQAPAQVQAPAGGCGGGAAGGAPAAPEEEAAGGGGGGGGGGERQEAEELAVKVATGGGLAEGWAAVPSAQSPRSRPAAAGGCFSGCFGGRRASSSAGAGAGQHQRQRQHLRAIAE